MANDHPCQLQASIRSYEYECLLFDVDDTLYCRSYGFSKQCSKNIEEFMVHMLGIQEKEVCELNKILYKKYGTSLAGLKAMGYEFDNQEYHSFVHGRLPYENLKPDPVLRNLILSLPIRKVIFSNADKRHVDEVVRRLGLDNCFEEYVNFESLNPSEKTSTNSDGNGLVRTGSSIAILDWLASNIDCTSVSPIVCKPFGNAFERAFEIAKITPERTLFFDDSTSNIQSGKSLGLHTVLVGTSRRTNGADYALESIHNFTEVLLGRNNKIPIKGEDLLGPSAIKARIGYGKYLIGNSVQRWGRKSISQWGTRMLLTGPKPSACPTFLFNS